MASVKARYLAEAGIARAIAELKNDARTNFAYNNNVSISGGQYLGEGVYTVDIKDEASRININNTENPNLAQLLKNLKDAIGSSTLTDADCNAIASNAPYETKKQILSILTGTQAERETKYNAIKDFITVHSYKDPNCSNRSPININTAQHITLKAVLMGLSDGTTTISDLDASILASAIITDITNNGSYKHPYGWQRFKKLVDDTLSSTDKTEVIVNNCNPNRTKPSTFTTEFCFHSGGYYSIVSTGKVREAAIKISERRINTIVKIYDIWNQTTKEQFRGEDADYDGVLDSGEDVNGNGVLDVPDYERITWKDSCPVRTDQKWYSSNYDTIKDSLKLGFWDDFEDAAYSSAQWKAYRGARVFGGSCMTIYKSDSQPRIDLYDPINPDRWKFQTHYAQAYLNDNHGQQGSNQVWLHSESARFCFKGKPGTTTDSSLIHTLYCKGTPYGDLPSAFELWIKVVGNPLDDTYKDEAEGTHPPRWGWYTIFKVWSYPNNTYGEEVCTATACSATPPRVLRVSKAMGSQYTSPGVIRIYHPYWDKWQRSHWDNIRVIPAKDASDSKYGKGIYTSTKFTPETYAVDWGTIYGTVTIPATANAANETVRFATSADNYVSDIGSGGGIVGDNSTSIKYRAILQTKGTAEGQYKKFETPVLEDVYITYMGNTKILYWGE